MVIACVVALACLAVAVDGFGKVRAEQTRPPTDAELRRASTAEVATRWRTWPAGRIFPEKVGYPAEFTGEESARRVGIARQTDCAGAVEESVVRALRDHRCQAGIRATYTDPLGGVVTTVGVLAFPDESSAEEAMRALPGGSRPVLRALAVPNTAAAKFTDAARQTGSSYLHGPYLLLTSTGYADGRPAGATRQKRAEVFAPMRELAARIATPLIRPATPDCDSPEWAC